MPYLQECVESVLSQRFEDWELILSDDGSSDGSREYLASLQDPRIHIHLQDKNQGIFGNLNFLFSQARAEFSYILCQDDYFYSDALTTVNELWEQQGDDIAFICFNRPEANSSAERALPSIVPPDQSDLFFYLLGNIPGNLSCVSLRTDLPRQIGGFSQSLPYAGDFDFWTRAGRQRPFRQTSQKTAFIRRHENVASIHLNQRGEYVHQGVYVVNRLYEGLQTNYSRWKLKLHGTVIYDAQQRHTGVMLALRQWDFLYLASFLKSSTKSLFRFHPLTCWLIWGVSGGAHWGREVASKMILSENGDKTGVPVKHNAPISSTNYKSS